MSEKQICKSVDKGEFLKYKQLLDSIFSNSLYPYNSAYKNFNQENQKLEYVHLAKKDLSIGKVFYKKGDIFYPHNSLNEFDMYNKENQDNTIEYNYLLNLIEKYQLTNLQIIVLLINYDLLNILFKLDNVNTIYGKKLDFINFDKDNLINNFKSLISDDIIPYLTVNGLNNLKDNFIFFIDIQKLLEKYENINNIDIIRLIIGKNITNQNDLILYLDLLNGLDDTNKDRIISSMSNIFSSSLLFPNIDIEDANKISENIINQNPAFFYEYKDFFENELSYEYLSSIKDKNNFDEIIKFFYALRLAIINSIPNYFNNLEKVPIYETEKKHHKINPDCGAPYEYSYKYVILGYKIDGSINYGEDLIKLEKNIFSYIKQEINNPNFSFENLLNQLTESIHQTNSNNLFITNLTSIYINLNKNHKKILSNN